MSNQLASNIMLFLSLTRQLNGGFQQCHRGRYTTGIISTPEILNPRDSFTKSLSVLPPGLSCWYSCCTLRKLRNGEHWWSFSSLYWGKGGDFPFLITKKSENSFNDFLRMSLSLQLYVKRQRKYTHVGRDLIFPEMWTLKPAFSSSRISACLPPSSVERYCLLLDYEAPKS